MTALVYDDVYLKHDTGSHPECAHRLRVIMAHLRHCKILRQMKRMKPRCASIEEIMLVHDGKYVFEVERMCQAGGGKLDSDTVASRETFDVARYAVGGVETAVDAVMSGEAENALALVRPPGHHARRGQGMGFCIFNNVAIAAKYLQKKHGVGNVLIVDWDVHHGNGTQEIFYRDGTVCYFSVHRWPFWPGSGTREEMGQEAGQARTVNRPVAVDGGRNAFLGAFQEGLAEALANFTPGFILISAGFDAYENDPVGGLGLQMGDFKYMTDIVVAAADKHCGGRLVSALEGGYDLRDLGPCVEQHILGLLHR